MFLDPLLDAAERLDLNVVKHRVAKYAATTLGSENVRSLQPSSIFAEVRDELDRVQEMIDLVRKEEHPDFGGVSDIREALHRASLEGSVLTAEALLHVQRFLSASRAIRVFFDKRSAVAPLLGALGELLFQDKPLEYHIDRVIDENGSVRDSASKELREVRRAIVEKSNHLRRRLETILKRISKDDLVQEELITLRDARMVIPVKTEYKHTVPGFIHSSSATGQTVYIEPAETLELNNEIRELEFQEQREVMRLLNELTVRVRAVTRELLSNLEFLSHLDSIYARARYAVEFDAHCPVVQLRGTFELNLARHPILLMHKRAAEVVPLSLALGDDTTTIIITGPNAGGKSVAMKTAGLLSLMTQSGIPITADPTSRLPVYTKILVDIGDQQSVENDLSTFSSHISKLARIVEAADDTSLVLIDEIGTGTDPAEGSALGAAILERLTTNFAHVIATTHHGMLKAFADQHPRMQNAAMEFDLTSLQPTYRFRLGLPGSSYAFEITRRHGMESRIIDRARDLIGSQTNSLEHLLGEVERRSQILAQQMTTLDAEQQRLDRLIADYSSRMKTLKDETQRMKRAAVEQADGIVAGANAAIESAIRSIREQQASRESIKQARENIDDVKVKLRQERREQEESAARSLAELFKKGDHVFMIDNQSLRGIVLDDMKSDTVHVAFGSVKLKIGAQQLRRADQPDAAVSFVSSDMVKPHSHTTEIDIRGMYGDEAVRTLDTFLYEAFLIDIQRVDVIHGKGTGALRKRVHEYLRTLTFVESFQLANWNEGGAGMTVVLLKKK